MADYGRDMSADECVKVAERVIANTLKDPAAAQFRHSPCLKGAWGSAPLLGMKAAFGWMQRGEVNGKNSYGGYVGFKSYQALINDGVVVRYCVTDDNGACWPKKP